MKGRFSPPFLQFKQIIRLFLEIFYAKGFFINTITIGSNRKFGYRRRPTHTWPKRYDTRAPTTNARTA